MKNRTTTNFQCHFQVLQCISIKLQKSQTQTSLKQQDWGKATSLQFWYFLPPPSWNMQSKKSQVTFETISYQKLADAESQFLQRSGHVFISFHDFCWIGTTHKKQLFSLSCLEQSESWSKSWIILYPQAFHKHYKALKPSLRIRS